MTPIHAHTHTERPVKLTSNTQCCSDETRSKGVLLLLLLLTGKQTQRMRQLQFQPDRFFLRETKELRKLRSTAKSLQLQ